MRLPEDSSNAPYATPETSTLLIAVQARRCTLMDWVATTPLGPGQLSYVIAGALSALDFLAQNGWEKVGVDPSAFSIGYDGRVRLDCRAGLVATSSRTLSQRSLDGLAALIVSLATDDREASALLGLIETVGQRRASPYRALLEAGIVVCAFRIQAGAPTDGGHASDTARARRRRAEQYVRIAEPIASLRRGLGHIDRQLELAADWLASRALAASRAPTTTTSGPARGPLVVGTAVTVSLVVAAVTLL